MYPTSNVRALPWDYPILDISNTNRLRIPVRIEVLSQEYLGMKWRGGGGTPAGLGAPNAESDEMIIKLAQATASKAPKARHIPAWGEAPWTIAPIESEGRRPDLYPSGHERAAHQRPSIGPAGASLIIISDDSARLWTYPTHDISNTNQFRIPVRIEVLLQQYLGIKCPGGRGCPTIPESAQLRRSRATP
jgi:hypothetical protein